MSPHRPGDEQQRHTAEPVYVGCPHCMAPVYFGAQLNRALADLALTLLPLAQREDVREAVERAAQGWNELAWMDAQDRHPLRALALLRPE